MKQKMLVAFTKMQFNGPDKKESRKSGCHFNMPYGSAKTEQNIKVCDAKQGFCCQEDQNKE